jgi:hypothetical protein
MKKYSLPILLIFISVIILLLLNENSQLLSIVNSITRIKVEITEIDMGEMKLGNSKNVSYKIQNIGEQPLLIKNVEASCGCAKPAWPNKPILPGKEGEIAVQYEAKLPGRFVKSLKVYCNNERGFVLLKLKGIVKLSTEVPVVLSN